MKNRSEVSVGFLNRHLAVQLVLGGSYGRYIASGIRVFINFPWQGLQSSFIFLSDHRMTHS